MESSLVAVVAATAVVQAVVGKPWVERNTAVEVREAVARQAVDAEVVKAVEVGAEAALVALATAA